MSAKILTFDRCFIAIDEKAGIEMTIEAIRNECRERGWPGMRIDWPEYDATGVLVVYRMSMKDATR